MPDSAALSDKLRITAASVGTRGGHSVPLHYGSAAGELALCIRSVGVVDREDLGVWTLAMTAAELDGLTAEHFVGGLGVGEAASAQGAHWARIGVEQALFVAPSTVASEQLPVGAGGSPDELVVSSLLAIGLVGPGTPGLLVDLGAECLLDRRVGEGKTAATALAGALVTWMALDDTFALGLVEPAQAIAVWNAIAVAGHRFGLGYVGAEAAERFEATRCRTSRPCRIPS